MKYYIDTEFIEGIQKNSKNPTIDLISIGIVCEDGREYYAICNEFNIKEAWYRKDDDYWLRKNVLLPIFIELGNKYDEDFGLPKSNKYYFNPDIKDSYENFTYGKLKDLIKLYGNSKKEILEGIREFTLGEIVESKCQCQERVTCYYCEKQMRIMSDDNIRFYGWYADYDWVVFCWLFGRMIDLPEEYPNYCYDIQQLFDEKKKKVKGLLKDHPEYPVNRNSHNALDDAKFHKDLHEFLIRI